MEEKVEGKRLVPEPSGKKPVALIAIGSVAAVLIAAYLGLCIYVGQSSIILPHVSAAGVDVGGMTVDRAQTVLEERMNQVAGNLQVQLDCGNWSGTLPGGSVSGDAGDTAQQAWKQGREFFLAQGFQFLRYHLGGSAGVELTAALNGQGQTALENLLDEADRALPDMVVQPDWRSDGVNLILTQGVPGRILDHEQATADTEAALRQGLNDLMAGTGTGTVTVTISAQEAAPDRLDLQKVHDELYTEPRDAEFDVASRSIIPQVTGISFDVAEAQARLDAAEEGQQLSVPLILTEPEMTTQRLESHLFSDLLGECTTKGDGTANRVSNVSLAASRCDEYILLPGDVFSYNGIVGPRTLEAGFKPAPAYVKGETVDEVGGGICQVSSTIYLAALRANLEIVERRNHTYISSYITAGMDATVAYNAIDFKFKNDTEYPIKIEAGVNQRTLTVRIYGAKTDDITVKMTYSILSSTPADIVYKPDETVPAGTTKVSVTPYTGYKVVVYRNLYDGDGRLIGSTQESMNTYNKRDKVILYNPADAESLGITTGGGTTPSTPEPTPSPEPSPIPSPEPTPSPEPSAPAETQPPSEPSETPSPSPTTDPGSSDPEPVLPSTEGE